MFKLLTVLLLLSFNVFAEDSLCDEWEFVHLSGFAPSSHYISVKSGPYKISLSKRYLTDEQINDPNKITDFERNNFYNSVDVTELQVPTRSEIFGLLTTIQNILITPYSEKSYDAMGRLMENSDGGLNEVGYLRALLLAIKDTPLDLDASQ